MTIAVLDNYQEMRLAHPAFFECLKRRSSVYRPICDSLLIRGGCMNWPTGGHAMVSKRIGVGKTVASVLLCLLLCGVVAAEFPEFLSLTDNTANDFTVSKANIVVLRAFPDASRHVRMPDIDFNISAPTSRFSHLNPFEKAALPPLELFILHSILRM